MNAFLGRTRVACGPYLEDGAMISAPKLLQALNTLLSNPSSALEMADLEAIFKMSGISPTGAEQHIDSEQFLKQVATLFAHVLSGPDEEDRNPFDVLVAYRDLFNRIDSDHDGRLYPDQLHELVKGLTRMESAGISRSPDIASTEMIVNHLDKAKKGYVDYTDFLTGALVSTEASSSVASSIENTEDEDTEFKSALGPTRQHDSVFDDQMEMDYNRPEPRAVPNNESASLQQMQTQAHLLEQRLSTAQSELDKSEQSRSELLGRLNEQDKQIEGYKKQVKMIAEMEQERHRISDEMEQLRADLHTAKDSLRVAAKLEADLAAERDRLREDLFQKGKEINDIEDQLRFLKDSAAGSQGALNELAALKSELEAQNARYAALTAAKDEQDMAHVKLLEELQELQSKHELTLLEVEEAKRKFSDLNDEKLAMSSSPMRPNRGNLKAELSSAMRPPTTPSKYGMGTSVSADQTSTTSSGSATLSSDVNGGNNDEIVVQLKVELDMMSKEKKALIEHLSKADAKAAQLEREKTDLNARIASLSSELTNAERAKGSLQRQYEESKIELEEMKSMLQAAQDAVTAANAAAAKAAASAFVRPEATMTENELEELRVLRLSRRELEEHIAKLKQQIDGDSIQLKAMRNELQQLRDLNRTLKARIAQMPEETVPLNSEEDLRRGLIGSSRVNRHDQGCCAACNIM